MSDVLDEVVLARLGEYWVMDAKAKRILFRTYWSNGWLPDGQRQTSLADFEYAKQHGVMFDPVSWTHDGSVDAVQQFREVEFGRAVAAGFVASLSSRRLEWRSAFASWSMIERLPHHGYSPSRSGESYDQQGNIVSTS